MVFAAAGSVAFTASAGAGVSGATGATFTVTSGRGAGVVAVSVGDPGLTTSWTGAGSTV